MAIHPVFIQAGYYGILMLLTIGFVSLFQKGFFWKYVKVRMSFGKYILVKVRAINRDYFAIGKVDESFLVFKTASKNDKRLSLENNNSFYKCLSVTCIDVYEQKDAILTTDMTGIEGFDATKYNDLYLRALYKPALNDNREKLIMLLLIGIAIGVVVVAFLTWQTYAVQSTIANTILNRGVVTPGVI